MHYTIQNMTFFYRATLLAAFNGHSLVFALLVPALFLNKRVCEGQRGGSYIVLSHRMRGSAEKTGLDWSGLGWDGLDFLGMSLHSTQALILDTSPRALGKKQKVFVSKCLTSFCSADCDTFVLLHPVVGLLAICKRMEGFIDYNTDLFFLAVFTFVTIK